MLTESEIAFQVSLTRRDTHTVSLRIVYLTYFGLLFAAMFSVSPSLQTITIAWMFPFGFSMCFRTVQEGTGTVLPAVAYGLYALFFCLFGAFRRRPIFFLLCAAYIVFLLLNVSGCRKMIGGFSSVT